MQWAYIAAGAPASKDGTPLAAAAGAGAVMGQAGVVALTVAAVASAFSIYAALQAPVKAYVLIAGLLLVGSAFAALARPDLGVRAKPWMLQGKGPVSPSTSTKR